MYRVTITDPLDNAVLVNQAELEHDESLDYLLAKNTALDEGERSKFIKKVKEEDHAEYEPPSDARGYYKVVVELVYAQPHI